MIYEGEELAKAMAENMIKRLENIIDSHKHLPAFYILVYSKANIYDPRIIETKYILTKSKPVALIGTMCFRVDNKEGKLEIEWLLPQMIDKRIPLEYYSNKVREWVKESETKFWQGRL